MVIYINFVKIHALNVAYLPLNSFVFMLQITAVNRVYLSIVSVHKITVIFSMTLNHVVKLYVIILMPSFNLTLLCVLFFFVTYHMVCN